MNSSTVCFKENEVATRLSTYPWELKVRFQDRFAQNIGNGIVVLKPVFVTALSQALLDVLGEELIAQVLADPYNCSDFKIY